MNNNESEEFSEQFSYTSYHFTPHGRYELNKLTSLPMCGFIAQLVEQRTVNAEVAGSNPVEALIFFSGFFFPIAQIGKFTAMIILIYNRSSKMNYFIYFTSIKMNVCICGPPWLRHDLTTLRQIRWSLMGHSSFWNAL